MDSQGVRIQLLGHDGICGVLNGCHPRCDCCGTHRAGFHSWPYFPAVYLGRWPKLVWVAPSALKMVTVVFRAEGPIYTSMGQRPINRGSKPV